MNAAPEPNVGEKPINGNFEQMSADSWYERRGGVFGENNQNTFKQIKIFNCSQATAVGIRAKFKYNAIVLV